jgi:acyl-[acyl-carrier-protein]-phospholipid O-acyltransferase/long-chain-fatty-acid--[acyl-carrier-protein] ligase
MGGMFIVPLNSLIQFHAKEEQMGTVLAGNNWVQNVAMLTALGLTVLFALWGIDSVGLFYILTAVAIIGTGYTVRKLPHSLVRIIATAILKRRYRVEVIGFENIPRAGATLMLGNHISWIDWALVQIACPRPLRFVMLQRIYETWYLNPFFKVFGAIPIAAGKSEESLATINQLLKDGECVCLFPEGAISRNGQLGKFHTGYERALDGVVEGVIIPFYLRGLWGSSFSRADEGLRNARAPDVRRDLIVAFGPALPLNTDAKQLKQKVFELSLSAWHSYASQLDPIPLAWLRAARRQPSHNSCADTQGTRLNNRQMVAQVTGFAGALKLPRTATRVGVVLPASTAAVIATMAIQLRGRSVVHLDISQGCEFVQSVLDTTTIKQVITSREYAVALAAGGVDINALLQGVDVMYVEDLQQSTPPWRGLIAKSLFSTLPVSWLYGLYARKVCIEDPAAIVCYLDKKHAQRAVVLSHRNMMANCKQVSDVLNTQLEDVMLCSHSLYYPLGLTVQTIMPLVEGIPMICHADSTDALGIAKAIARNSVTILLGTSRLFDDLTNNVGIHPLMLESLRLVVAGSEPLDDELRVRFELKFSKKIYAGYGVPEASPVVSVNIPDAMATTDWKVQQGNQPGSVGMPLPGTSFRIVDGATGQGVPLGTRGDVLVSGDQVMVGYLNDAAGTDHVLREMDGLRWLHTGDVGHLTEEGFLVVESD